MPNFPKFLQLIFVQKTYGPNLPPQNRNKQTYSFQCQTDPYLPFLKTNIFSFVGTERMPVYIYIQSPLCLSYSVLGHAECNRKFSLKNTSLFLSAPFQTSEMYEQLSGIRITSHPLLQKTLCLKKKKRRFALASSLQRPHAVVSVRQGLRRSGLKTTL